jgi:hypothetical protein
LSRGGETLMSRRVYRMQQTPSSADDMTTLTAMKIVLAPGAMLAGHFSPRADDGHPVLSASYTLDSNRP